MNDDRRGIYFSFQGLLMAVLLLLLFVSDRRGGSQGAHLALLLLATGGSLAFLRLTTLETLSLWRVQMGLFVGDAALVSLILHWTRSDSSLDMIYVLILFGTALTRRLSLSLVVAGITSGLYILSAWHPGHALPSESEFWLRILFLWIAASLLAILSRDTGQAQREQERLYHDRLLQAESLAALGEVAGEIAHRIKAPLTTIMVNAELLSHRFSKSKTTVKELEQITEEVGRCKEILKSLLDLGRIEEIDFVPVDLRDPLRAALRSIGPQMRKRGLRLQLGPMGSPLPVRGDPSLLFEAILALLQNAVDASKAKGRIGVSSRPRNAGSGWFGGESPYCELSISDEGEGIPRENLGKIFKPLFTTKGKEGSGFGLSAALRIMEKHGGSVEAASEGRGRGARFTLRVPAADD